MEATKLDLVQNGSIQNRFSIKYQDWLCVSKYIYIYIFFIYVFSLYIHIHIYAYIKKIYVYLYIYKENICIFIFIYTQSILVFDIMQVLYWPVLGLSQFCSFDRRCKTCLDNKPVLIPLQNWLCACSKTSFVSSLDLLHQNRLCACSLTGFASALNLPFHLNKYFDCVRGKVWLTGFGFSSPYRGFNLSIWY